MWLAKKKEEITQEWIIIAGGKKIVSIMNSYL